MNIIKTFQCSFCKQKFNHNQCLQNHLSKFHLQEIALKLDAEISYKHNCILCDKKFKFLRSLRRHERKSHSMNSPKYTNRLKCPLCEFATSEKNDFSKHIETNHNITIKTEEYLFSTVNEFNQWKEKVEKETCSRYNKKSGCYKGVDNSRRFYYGCHRSGYFVPNTKGKKSLKAKGSKKINGTCPSSIQVLEAEDGTCVVKFVQTHVGHGNEIFHLYLSEKEKKSIAKDILNNVPFDEILNRVRDSSASESSLKRIHLLTKKDLHNIKRSLNSNSITIEDSDVGDKNDDSMTAEDYVEEIDISPSNQVICEIITAEEHNFELNLDGSINNGNILVLDSDFNPVRTHEISITTDAQELFCGFNKKIENLKTQYLALLDSVQNEKEYDIFAKHLTEIEDAINDARTSKVMNVNN